MAILDLRRTDQRTNIRINPLWVTSAAFGFEAGEGDEAVLFSFPVAGEDYFIHNVMIEISTLFAGGTPSMTIGEGTLATDVITTGGSVDSGDADEYFASTDVTEATAACYMPTSTLTEGTPNTQTGTDFAMARTIYGGKVIQGAATACPCIYAVVADTTLTAGVARLHVLMSKLQS